MSQGKYTILSQPVLLVDDEADILDYLKSIFVEELEYPDVITAENPVKALEKLGNRQPLLIISDYNMPQMTGLEFCAQIKSLYPLVPFVLGTGHADKNVMVDSINYKVDTLLEKPFQHDMLKLVITDILDVKVAEIEAEIEELDELIECFVEEAQDILDDFPNLILRLEDEYSDSVLIDLLFRKIHTVKGGASALPQAKELAHLAHCFENVLGKIRDRVVVPVEDDVDLFLRSVDYISNLIEILSRREAVDHSLKEEVGQISDQLNAIITGDNRQKSELAVDSNVGSTSKRAFKDDDQQEDKGVLVTNEKLDNFMKLSGELIVLKNSIQQMCADLSSSDSKNNSLKMIMESSQNLNKITDALQEQIMDVRRVSLGQAYSKLPRMVRQTSKKLGKKIALYLEGQELSVDKSISRVLSGSLTHLIRNSIDHGIELPSERQKKSKPEEGSIRVISSVKNEKIFVRISDDGGGISRERVLKKAIENALVAKSKAESMTDEEIFDLIFHAGFSTAEQVTDVSGRGVGMDVVKSDIVSLNGKVKILSEEGKGTEILIEIPVPKTVMVEKSIIVESRNVAVAIPQINIAQILSGDSIELVDFRGDYGFLLNGKTLPLIQLSTLYEEGSSLKSEDVIEGNIVVVFYKNYHVGVFVEKIRDQIEAVIRPFNRILGDVHGFQGTSLLGNDGVAYVISPEDIIESVFQIQKVA